MNIKVDYLTTNGLTVLIHACMHAMDALKHTCMHMHSVAAGSEGLLQSNHWK